MGEMWWASAAWEVQDKGTADERSWARAPAAARPVEVNGHKQKKYLSVFRLNYQQLSVFLVF